MQRYNDTRIFEIVVDGENDPVRVETQCPTGVLNWAQRHHVDRSFEIRLDGRRVAKARYLPTQVWQISP